MVGMNVWARCVATVFAALVGAAGCTASDAHPDALHFGRSGISVPWTLTKRHGSTQIRTENNGIRDSVKLTGDRFPQQIVGWRDGGMTRSLLVVPLGADLSTRGPVSIEVVTDESGHRVVLASARNSHAVPPTVSVKWPGDRITFGVVPSPS